MADILKAEGYKRARTENSVFNSQEIVEEVWTFSKTGAAIGLIGGTGIGWVCGGPPGAVIGGAAGFISGGLLGADIEKLLERLVREAEVESELDLKGRKFRLFLNKKSIDFKYNFFVFY